MSAHAWRTQHVVRAPEDVQREADGYMVRLYFAEREVRRWRRLAVGLAVVVVVLAVLCWRYAQ